MNPCNHVHRSKFSEKSNLQKRIGVNETIFVFFKNIFQKIATLKTCYETLGSTSLQVTIKDVLNLSTALRKHPNRSQLCFIL